jgi:hypothetical protein
MKRFLAAGSALALALTLASAVRADVTTKEKVTFKLEGMLGRMMNVFGGSAAKNGITSTVALNGNRMSRLSDTTGQIIDLTEEKVYDLDIKKKEYKVTTFAELRQRLKEAREKAEQDMKNRPPEEKQDVEEAGKQIEFEADVKETGERKNIAGYDTRQVVLTITGHEKGKTLEESGGFIMTNDMWMGPRIAALDEIGAFQMKYVQAVYGEALQIDPQQMAALSAMFPSFQKMTEQMQSQGKKMDGTALLTTMTFESMKSAEEMKKADSGSEGGGGGLSGRLGGFLARKMAGPAKQRNTILTTTLERLSVSPTATAQDVAIPAGFKEKK